MKKILIVILTGLWTCRATHNCCGDENSFVAENLQCLDGSRFALKCSESIPIEADEVNYTIDSLNNLDVDGEEELIPWDTYCFATKNDTRLLILCPEEESSNEVLRYINTILQIISVVFIVLTVGIYLSVPELQDVQGIIMMHSISGLGMGYIFLITIQLGGPFNDRACHVLAYSMYFSLMYAFFWLNALCFHIWRQVMRPTFLENVRNWKTIYHVYGLGAPTICVAVLIFVNHARLSALETIHPGINEGKCWFKSLRTTFIYFYGPISVLILANIIYFIWTAAALWKQCANDQTKIHHYRLRLYAKLFIIMGITWVFEVISAGFANKSTQWVFILTDAANALEGLTIFLILVVFRKRVKRYLANKKICNYKLPARWKQEVDSECDPIEEEVSLAVVPN